MKEIRNCKIVQDLLPNYIDGLTNEETNVFIENHLKECSECKKTFENMKQELDITKPSRNSNEVKYLKKFNKKLLILRVLVFILLLVALSVTTYHYNTMKNAYFKASNIMVDMVKEGMYPDTFYATIEEISDPGVYGLKEIKVKGLNINDNFKLKWNNTNINFEQLKVGQKVAIYNYGEILDNGNLSSVRMIVVLDDTL